MDLLADFAAQAGGTVISDPEGRAAFDKGAIKLDSLASASEFTNAFKKSWASGERILPSSFAHAGKQGALGALAGAGISTYQQGDITAPASLNGATTMGIGAASVVGGVMAWKFGKRLKTSIYSGMGRSTKAAEAAQEVEKAGSMKVDIESGIYE